MIQWLLCKLLGHKYTCLHCGHKKKSPESLEVFRETIADWQNIAKWLPEINRVISKEPPPDSKDGQS